MPDIDFQKIVLNLIPKKGDDPVIFYASQFETARPFIADLMWGETEFAPGDDCWAEVDIRKNDDNLVVITDDVSIDNNEVSVILPVQALTCIGKNLGQVKIYAADDQLVCALNFILEVQADPLAGGVTSETAIDNLTEQIEEITQQVIGDDYYNKTEVDDLLSDKADQATTYTKSEVDTALNLKADKATTYTKTQVDSALALKADASNVYTKSQTDTLLNAKANTSDLATVATTGDYDDLINKPSIPAAQVQSDYAQADNTQVDYIKNKPDINAMIADALLEVMPVGNASGPIANFDTELAVPLVNVSCDVVATGGNGTPDNPNPINGYSSANITRCGVNLFDGTWEIGHRWESDGTYSIQADKNAGTPDKMPCKPNTTYTFVMNNIIQTTYFFVSEFDISENHIQKSSSVAITTSGKIATFTTGANTYFIAFSLYALNDFTVTEVSETGINYPSTDTTYHPYNGQPYTIAFGQTVYGGVLDVTRGKLHVTWGICDLTDYNYTYNSTHGAFYTYGLIGTIKADMANILCSHYKTNIVGVNVMNNYEISTVNSFNTGNVIIKDSNYTDAATFKTALGTMGAKLAFELATPFDIDLTPEVILAIVGENNVYSDTNGDTTVQYKDSIQHYIDQRT